MAQDCGYVVLQWLTMNAPLLNLNERIPRVAVDLTWTDSPVLSGLPFSSKCHTVVCFQVTVPCTRRFTLQGALAVD